MANGEGTYNSTRCVPPPPEVDGEVFDLFTTPGFMGWKTRDKLIEKRINIVKVASDWFECYNKTLLIQYVDYRCESCMPE